MDDEPMTAEQKQFWDLEERIEAHQHAWITKRFGKEAADEANYGWGVDEHDNGVSYATKIYGHGVLTTDGDIRAHELEDHFRPL